MSYVYNQTSCYIFELVAILINKDLTQTQLIYGNGIFRVAETVVILY